MSHRPLTPGSNPSVGAALAGARGLIDAGRRTAAVGTLQTLEPRLQGDPGGLQSAGEMFLACGRVADALRCYQAAVALAAGDPRALYNLASTLVAVGDLLGAEKAFDRVIALDPADADAFHNRSTLRKWTPDDNHLASLTTAIAGVRHPAAEVALCYALAKEHEDLGDHQAAWSWLARGAARRRALMSYRVEADLETMAQIEAAFDASRMSNAAASAPSGPVFILGLPRSGTTLVDRIVSAHSQVESLGEIPDFALSLMDAAGSATSKSELVARSARMDFQRLGQAYETRVRDYGRPARFLIDKTPANYLYIGLIALSLPGSVIIHVRRDPMDNGYALLKTLFRTGCPYSYDQSDLARYIAAFERLMTHWRSVLPGRVVEVNYEDLIEDQEGQSRRLIAALGLKWEAACLAFHTNPSPSATASAAQVRRPLYRDSVGLWRRYAPELSPLAAGLGAAG